MKRFLPSLFALLLLLPLSIFAQSPEPFDGCPGVSVAITRPGLNNNLVPHQIYLIDANGVITSTGDPINLQINAFGLNSTDGFLYGMHEVSNVANPFLTRVGKNGKYEDVGTVVGPTVDPFKVAIINTAAGTMDDSDNYYFTAAVVDLSNLLTPPALLVGKIEKVSTLAAGNNPLTIAYKKVDFGTCLSEFLNAVQNPLSGLLQDIAFNTANGAIYTFFPAVGGTGGKIAWFNPSDASPQFNCITPSSPNPATKDLSGLYFGADTSLFILTIDGKFYNGDVQTGAITLVTQTTLPLLNGNLRGDMASCVGSKKLIPFEGCPGISLAITRPGNNSSTSPYHIYTIQPDGSIQPVGHDIALQINAFGLNTKDGFLYGMHESANIVSPNLTRMDSKGDFVDIGTIAPPAGSATRVGVINTAAASMDGNDNYYFTAAIIDASTPAVPELYLGTIHNVSQLNPGDNIQVTYQRVQFGSCIDEIIQLLPNFPNGILQDIAFDPQDGRLYTFIPGAGGVGGKIAWLDPTAASPVATCIDPSSPNPAITDLSGLYFSGDGTLYMLTIDGKFYSGNVQTGVVSLVTQTTLPLLNGNLRGDMASCIGAGQQVQLYPFEGCPGLAVAVTRPGINSTGGPHHIYTIDPSNGNVQPVGHNINLQINAFGLNTQDGFLYGMHEVSEVFNPRLTRVGNNGDYVDINIIPLPPATGNEVRAINTAAATMDGNDNYYFTAVTADANVPGLPTLYLGIIRNISQLHPSDDIQVTYRRVLLGSCSDEIIQSLLSNPSNGLLQDMVYNPQDGKIYTYFQNQQSPASGKLASFDLQGTDITLNCIDPPQPNPPTQDLSGMHGSNNNGKLFILTIDGKYYEANPHNGRITFVAQTNLPLLGNNLRGDMASCVPHENNNPNYRQSRNVQPESTIKISPNPVTGDEVIISVNSQEQTPVELRIMDVNGHVLKMDNQTLIAGDNQLRVPVKNVKGGMYTAVLVFPSGKTLVTKFIRQ